MSKKSGKNIDIIAVARAAKVSPSTVSRSFNHPDLVKLTTRKKIDIAVRKLGYIRNRAAQTIHGIRNGTIGLIVPTINHTIFAELIQSFSTAVEARGFTILVASHGYNLNREYMLARKMLEHRVDGIGLIGLEHASETYDLLSQQQTPALLLWNYAKDAQLPCVGSDNYKAGYLIGQHVAELNHHKIASIFPPAEGNDRASLRIQGMTDALRAHDLVIPDNWQLEAPFSISSAKHVIAHFLNSTERPTALICGNDVLAWGALHALAKRKIKIPEEITVTGIGDFNGSKDFEPSLTTVRIPARSIGEKAADAIVQLISTDGQADVSAMVMPELMIRQTSDLCYSS